MRVEIIGQMLRGSVERMVEGIRTGWYSGRAALNELVVGWAGGLREVGDRGEALGVERREAKCRAPNVELQHHRGGS